MLDYVCQRSLSTISKSIHYVHIAFMLFNLFCLWFHVVHSQSIEKPSLQRLVKIQSSYQTRRLLRVIYFREFDVSIDENRLRHDVKNLTEAFDVDLKINILNQSTSLLFPQLCSLISEESRDTILIADLYTKEVDLISRSLKIPTIATTNRYQIVQGKQYNPYLFKLMPDAIEEAQSLAYALDVRSVYTRIALIYDVSLDMIEYRLSYLRLAKQHIIYRAHLPRVSLSYDLHQRARKIIHDLTKLDMDLILCIMSTEREVQLIRLIKELNRSSDMNLLLNKTSWWFASRLGEVHNLAFFPTIYTANEDRRRLLGQFSSSSMKILLNAIIRTYIRLPVSSLSIGTNNCALQQTAHQLAKTRMFIQLFTNFTEWNCDIRVGSGIDPILFEPETLVWRVPTIFMVHTEHLCQGMLTRVYYSLNNNADQLFRSCRPLHLSSRKGSLSSHQDNSSMMATSSTSSNALVDIKNFHQMFGKLSNNQINDCQFVHINTAVQTHIVVGVVEPPYIFVSDDEISSEFHCNYGLHCYPIDPSLVNTTIDSLFFHQKTTKKPHCCYGISINLLLRIEDSKLVTALKSRKLFVFADKPNKWLALAKVMQDRRAHLSISAIPYESFLARSVDLSPPFYHSSYVILTVPRLTEPALGTFLQPFSWTTWCMIFLVLNATALFETFFEWHSPYGLTPRGRRRQKVFSLASALTLSWSIIFSHTFKTKSPKCWSNRFLGNVWGGLGIVFIAIYTAKLAAFMVDIDQPNSASHIHQIVDVCNSMPRCTVGVVANTSDEEYLRRFYTNTLYRQVQYVSSYGQGIDLLRSHSLTYLIMDHSMARYYLTRDVFKLIRISEDSFGSFGLSLGFTKFDTDLKENITNILLSYVDKGIIQRLHDDWYVYENCEVKILNENRKLSIDRFLGVFILLIAGMAVGCVILILEWLIFKYGVPCWRKRRWTDCLFFSQRLYAILNVSDDLYNKAYSSPTVYKMNNVGERLHNYSTRRDSVDLHVVNVPKLLSTTYELHERIKRINEQQYEQQQQQQQQNLYTSPNGDLQVKKDNHEKTYIRKRIKELELELKQLKSLLLTDSTSLDF